MKRSTSRRMVLSILSGTAIALASGCALLPGGGDAVDVEALLVSPLRSENDRVADARRKPAELISFAQVRRGMTVLDVSAGGGYTTQVMALAVGPQGKVWAQVQKPGAVLEKRLAQPGQTNIELIIRPFEDPFPASAPRVDLVTLVLSYHDIVNTPNDRMRMNRAMFAALKPGGRLVIMDHSGRPGTGLSETNTLHRIEEKALRAEVEAAGFVLEAQSDAWRNPADARDKHSGDAAATGDRFALRFVRPR
jgi:predicted methyltransferase